MRVFPGKIGIGIGRLSKANALPMWVGLIQSIEDPNRARRQRKGQFVLSAYLGWDIGLFLPLD